MAEVTSSGLQTKRCLRGDKEENVFDGGCWFSHCIKLEKPKVTVHSKQNVPMVKGDGSLVKSTCCFSRALEFNSQDLHRVAHNCL